MIFYDYFYRKRLPPDRAWDITWDVFVSSWDRSERVSHVFSSAQAHQKWWLIHAEYGFQENVLPDGQRFAVAGDEATSMIAFIEHLAANGVDIAHSRMCVDITGMIRPHIAFLVKLLKARDVRRFDVIYSEPTSYANREYTQFAIGPAEVREVIGFEGTNTVTSAREVLIVAPGFEESLLREVISHKEGATKVQIFGLPSLQADMYQQNVLKAYGTDTPLPEENSQQRRFASAADPFAVATELSRSVEWYSRAGAETRFYVAPLAAKTQALGAAIFYLTECEGSPVSIIYPFTAAYAPATSVGLSKIWCYTVDFDLCGALAARQ